MATTTDLEPDEHKNVISEIEPHDLEMYEETIETCIIDDHLEYIMEDENSNIGSMVSISEVTSDDENDSEFIVPEVMVSAQQKCNSTVRTKLNTKTIKKTGSVCWPTLEILPGGIINLANKEECIAPSSEISDENNEISLYTCAKCSQSFQYLFCLVKHVRWHENQSKTNPTNNVTNDNQNSPHKYICLHSNKRKPQPVMKSKKCKLPKTYI